MTSIPLILLRRSIFNQVVANVLDELGAPSPVEAATTALMQSLESAAQEGSVGNGRGRTALILSHRQTRSNTDDEEMGDKAERNVRLAASQHVKLADLLPTHEVFEVVKDVRVLFSFGSRLGGLDLAVKLRAELAERWGPGAGYVDLVDLRSHCKTRAVELTLPDGKQITKVLNPHWAEFDYMCMVLTETTVLIMDKACGRAAGSVSASGNCFSET
mmetsp:Transcript_22552/g.36306  ORF Transcript_22552/g.36306 Transcript_22552/m.36306 type:complete len:216 (-) Transcript_22552:614-1261(-)